MLGRRSSSSLKRSTRKGEAGGLRILLTSLANFFSLIRISHFLTQHNERDFRFAAVSDSANLNLYTSNIINPNLTVNDSLIVKLNTPEAIADYALHEQRRIYIEEGDYAAQKAQAMKEALAIVLHSHRYEFPEYEEAVRAYVECKKEHKEEIAKLQKSITQHEGNFKKAKEDLLKHKFNATDLSFNSLDDSLTEVKGLADFANYHYDTLLKQTKATLAKSFNIANLTLSELVTLEKKLDESDPFTAQLIKIMVLEKKDQLAKQRLEQIAAQIAKLKEERIGAATATKIIDGKVVDESLCGALLKARPLLLKQTADISKKYLERYLAEKVTWELEQNEAEDALKQKHEEFPEPYIGETYYEVALQLFKNKFNQESRATNRRNTLPTLDLIPSSPEHKEASSPENKSGQPPRPLTRMFSFTQTRNPNRRASIAPTALVEIKVIDENEKSMRNRKTSQPVVLTFPGIPLPTNENTVGWNLKKFFMHPFSGINYLLDREIDKIAKYFHKSKKPATRSEFLKNGVLALVLGIVMIILLYVRPQMSMVEKLWVLNPFDIYDFIGRHLKGTNKRIATMPTNLAPTASMKQRQMSRANSLHSLFRNMTGENMGESKENSQHGTAQSSLQRNGTAQSLPSTPRDKEIENKESPAQSAAQSAANSPRNERKSDDMGVVNPGILRTSFNSLFVPTTYSPKATTPSPKAKKQAWGAPAPMDLNSPQNGSQNGQTTPSGEATFIIDRDSIHRHFIFPNIKLSQSISPMHTREKSRTLPNLNINVNNLNSPGSDDEANTNSIPEDGVPDFNVIRGIRGSLTNRT